MCSRCVEIERQIDHYLGLSSDPDPLTAGAAKMVLADLRAEKLALHPNVANDT